MGNFFDKLGIDIGSKTDISIGYVEVFFKLNFPEMRVQNYHELNGKSIPTKDPEFTIHIVEKRRPSPEEIMVGDLYNVGLEYQGVEYFEYVPEHIFHWFCFLVEKEHGSDLKYKTKKEIDLYFVEQNKRRQELRDSIAAEAESMKEK